MSYALPKAGTRGRRVLDALFSFPAGPVEEPALMTRHYLNNCSPAHWRKEVYQKLQDAFLICHADGPIDGKDHGRNCWALTDKGWRLMSAEQAAANRTGLEPAPTAVLDVPIVPPRTVRPFRALAAGTFGMRTMRDGALDYQSIPSLMGGSPMRLRCPCCGASNSLDALIAHDAARTAVKAALDLDAALGGLVYQYLGLFRPAKNALGWDKVAGLLEELNPMISSAQIQRDGQSYPAPREVWKLALASTLAARSSLTLPLKTHGYLLGIIANMSRQQGKQAEDRSDMARSGNTRVAAGAVARPEMTRLPELPPRKGVPEELKNLVNARKKGSIDVSTEPPATGTAAAEATNPAAP